MDSALQSNADFQFPRAAGMNYLRFLGQMHKALQPEWYLEIGTNTGKSLVQSSAKSIAVDPNFVINREVYGNKSELHMVQKPSDDFFRDGHIAALGARIDLAFLDGMHLYEFLLRDFMNTERHANTGAHIVMHDCVPFTAEMTVRDQAQAQTRAWTGDVWKVVPILQKYRPDLTIRIFDARPTGLVVVSGLDSKNDDLWTHYAQIIAEYDEYEELELYFSSAQIEPTANSPWR